MDSRRQTDGRGERGSTLVAPLDGVLEARLELRRPRAGIAVHAAALDALCRATFEGRPPRAWVEGGRVGLEYPRVSLGRLARARRARIELGTAVPWSLVVTGGIRDSTFELGGLKLAGLAVQGGAAGVDLVLPRPRGLVRVHIDGGASRVRILRPAGAPARLRVAHGASRLVFDEERYGAIGGETRLESPDAGSASDRYEIHVDGGASTLTVAEVEEGAP